MPAVSKIALIDNSPYRILASTIISLRTRDNITWEVSNNLFEIAPTIDKLYSVDEETVANAIKKCGFYLRKANQLKRIASNRGLEWRNTSKRRETDDSSRSRNQDSKSCIKPLLFD